MTSQTSHSLNSLVKGTYLEGTIKAETDFRVDGTIKGSLNCSARLIIGPSGVVEGEARCASAFIEGRFEGNLNVAELLNIKESAEVIGEVKTNKLIIQSGAIFNVTCKMGSQHSNNIGNGAVKSNKEAKSFVKTAAKTTDAGA